MTIRAPSGSAHHHPWAIVLAAGDGVRLRPLTRRLYGCDLPKQFAKLVGGRSLLQATLDRIARLIPPHRTVVVVGEAHREVARDQLEGYRGVEVVVQPRNVGTAPGILLPLSRIRAHAPDASVAIFPSDHHVTRPRPLLDGVRTGLDSTRQQGGIALIGARAEHAETDYGWILAGQDEDAPRSAAVPVSRFVEKPGAREAECLLRQGALWNTFMMTGRAQELWETMRRHMPRTVELFEGYARSAGRDHEPGALAELYARLDPGDFSRDVLQHMSGLTVVPVHGSGWSDWGSPRRVFESLRGRPECAELQARLERTARPHLELVAQS